MIVAAISGQGWDQYPAAVRSLFARLIAAKPEYTIVLDKNALIRESVPISNENCEWNYHLIEFASWLRPGLAEDGVLDIHAIRGCAQPLSTDRPVVLDARGRRADLVAAALVHVRHAWFPMDDWHPAFILICDDLNLLSLSGTLANTFYCQPTVPSDKEINRIVKSLQRRALTQRWLGPGASRWQRKVFRYIRLAYRYFDRAADKRESRR